MISALGSLAPPGINYFLWRDPLNICPQCCSAWGCRQARPGASCSYCTGPGTASGAGMD
ncbi:hypothetical protein DFAR_2310022 [Desulfarculales bacterium]